MHPGYMSTDYARAQHNVKKIPVQHHHAHAVACMAENDLDEEVIAITLDGTGYGTDGHIWGGEILLCSQNDFKRKAHLSYIKMPGGDAAVLEPWRMAASILFKVFGNDFLNLNIPYIKEMEKEKKTLDRREKIKKKVFFFKQKKEYEILRSDGSSDVCASDHENKTTAMDPML